MDLYIVSYCENHYQKSRVVNFVNSQGGYITNTSFSERDENLHLTLIDCKKEVMQKAEQVWVILPGVLYNQFYEGVFLRERLAHELQLPLRYFKINQTGKYVGMVKEVKRKVLYPGKNNSLFCSFSDWRKLWGKK